METQILRELNEYRRKREAVVLVTELEGDRQFLVSETDNAADEFGASLQEGLQSGKARICQIGERQYFVHPYLPPARIVVIGAVHISQVMAPIAKLAGFEIEVVDPRTAFASDERFPDARLFAQWPDEYLADHPLDRYCALAAITHDPKIDDSALIAAIRANCFYVGALGSRKTHAKRGERLAAAGLDAAEIARINAPIGLDIGASSPAEIAVAVMGQIIEAFRRRGLSRRHAAEEERILDA